MTTSTTVTSVNLSPGSRADGFDQAQLRTAPTAILTIAAQGPLDDRGRLVHEDDPAAQLALTLAQVEGLLAAAALRVTDLAQLRLYTTDLDATLAVIDTLAERLGELGAHPPVTVVEVTRLPVAGATVALEAMAIH